MPTSGMLVQGRIAIEYGDGCREEFEAPAAVVVVPGHDGWVVGDEAAVLVQYDCGGDTVERLGLPSAHTARRLADRAGALREADTSNGGRWAQRFAADTSLSAAPQTAHSSFHLRRAS